MHRGLLLACLALAVVSQACSSSLGGPACAPAFDLVATGLPPEPCRLELRNADRAVTFDLRGEPADPFGGVCVSDTYSCAGPGDLSFVCSRGCGRLEVSGGSPGQLHQALALGSGSGPTSGAVRTTLDCGGKVFSTEAPVLYDCMY